MRFEKNFLKKQRRSRGRGFLPSQNLSKRRKIFPEINRTNAMRQEDIRWVQRYDSFSRACSRILEVTESARAAEQLSELEQEGLIQRFEYTF